jgi:ADP-glucose pyrophosphorylase
MPKRQDRAQSRIRRAIIGTGVGIPESSVIGYDAEADRARGYTVRDSGTVVVDRDCPRAMRRRRVLPGVDSYWLAYSELTRKWLR